jgi:hypothetical protein
MQEKAESGDPVVCLGFFFLKKKNLSYLYPEKTVPICRMKHL